jgi:anti-sigma B factor antagonist
MDIVKNYNGKELTMKLGDRIDTVTAPDFENEVMGEMGNFDSLIFDFENLEYISSAGLRVLILVQKKLKPDGIPFVIKNVNDSIREILRMAGFDKILDIQ